MNLNARKKKSYSNTVFGMLQKCKYFEYFKNSLKIFLMSVRTLTSFRRSKEEKVIRILKNSFFLKINYFKE